MMKSIVRVGFLLLLVGKFHAAPTPEDDGVCHEDDAVCQQQQRQQQPDRSLIQFKQALVAKHGRTNETYDKAEDAEEDEAEGAEEDEGEGPTTDECKGRQERKTPGCKRRLNPDGFKSLKRKCCGPEMMKFIRRLIKKRGKEVCHDAGLAGLTWWYDCSKPPDADKNADWDSLVGVIDDTEGSAFKGKCPWIKQPGVEKCPSRGSECPGDASASFPECT